MKNTKEPSDFTLSDMPSSKKIFSVSFDRAFDFVYEKMSDSAILMTEATIKGSLAEDQGITTDSARKILRDFRWLGLIEKKGRNIFLTAVAKNYYENRDDDVKKEILFSLYPPTFDEMIDISWFELLLFLRENKATYDEMLNLYLLEFDELKLQPIEIFNKIRSMGLYKKIMDTKSQNRISRIKSLLGLYDKLMNKDSHNDVVEHYPAETLLLVKRRKYQNRYRNELIIESNGITMLERIKNYEIAIASHIVDYKDSEEDEKYDPKNGLLLSPNVDKIFDRKIITFNENGNILIKPNQRSLLKALKISEGNRLNDEILTPERKRYLQKRNKKYFNINELIIY